MSPDDSSQFNVQIAAAVAAAWERYRDRLFENARPVSEWLVDQLAAQPGATILELTAGPGETGFLVAERIGSGGRLISTDISPAMVEAAKRGAQARGLTNVEFRVMDAQVIDLPDDAVDGVLSRFGIMLTPDPSRVVAETRRVLRSGGRLAYATWGSPDRNPWLTLVIHALLERGQVPEGDPFGAGGVFSLCDAHRNRELMGAAGYSDVRVEQIPGVMRYEGTDDYWEMQSSVAGPIAVLAASLDSEDIHAVRASLDTTLAPYRSQSGYEVPSLAVGVTGTA
jgi:ubiquinone/menaquinone biosynthesis C-methylase UbiE